MDKKYQVKYVYVHGHVYTIRYIFRYDPVPAYLGWGGKYGYRRAKTARERRLFYSVEDKSLVRARRRPERLWFAFDDSLRLNQKNWKFQTKNKRQHSFDQKKIREFKRMDCYEEIDFDDID